MKPTRLSERRRKEIAEAEKVFIGEKNPLKTKKEINKLNKRDLSHWELDEIFGGIDNE